ncbi:hypothetical protein KYN89_08470 [Alteriqipengyuania sp. NZ-12B]|uniref:DUF2269 family protein n=1 Tax=Alteriqipengyuania abyssalis TaxID=2860200 RepID=A0ABS7PDC6_9SPHN|nr:hypothetical protein [Alteriqipengyuania abyssalis]MBY8337083.1 hypothetical protein [Alteriqipengyuania abyssalis]
MGEEVALHIGAADVSWGELWPLGIFALTVPVVLMLPWAAWHVRDWRIRKARAAGKTEIADILALDHGEDNSPRLPTALLLRAALTMIAWPALIIFQENFADELEHMMGEGWGFAAAMLTLAFITACAWMWEKVKRNALSPDELAALEEEEEHQRWMRSIDGDSMPGLFVAIAFGAAILAGIIFFVRAITPL